jgi:hypothetical protein
MPEPYPTSSLTTLIPDYEDQSGKTLRLSVYDDLTFIEIGTLTETAEAGLPTGLQFVTDASIGVKTADIVNTMIAQLKTDAEVRVR